VDELLLHHREALEAFLDALYAANETTNVTRVPRDEAWERHIVDSLLFQDLIPPGSSVLDIGTGPGIPAWPLACARPDLRVIALDSNQKMLGFLRTQPLPNLKVIEARAEEVGITERYDVVTGRALAPLAIQLELSARPCKKKGVVIPMRTAQDESEIERLTDAFGLRLEHVEKRFLPGSEATRWFPIYRKMESTPKGIPRNWGQIKAKPR
jgi:16S rRNA (guanine527-N7)-methyltransferase